MRVSSVDANLDAPVAAAAAAAARVLCLLRICLAIIDPHWRSQAAVRRPRVVVDSSLADLTVVTASPDHVKPRYVERVPPPPDVRHPTCKPHLEAIRSSGLKLPNTSVIFCFCNEPESSLCGVAATMGGESGGGRAHPRLGSQVPLDPLGD